MHWWKSYRFEYGVKETTTEQLLVWSNVWELTADWWVMSVQVKQWRRNRTSMSDSIKHEGLRPSISRLCCSCCCFQSMNNYPKLHISREVFRYVSSLWKVVSISFCVVKLKSLCVFLCECLLNPIEKHLVPRQFYWGSFCFCNIFGIILSYPESRSLIHKPCQRPLLAL